MADDDQLPFRGSATIQLRIFASTLEEAELLIESAVKHSLETVLPGVDASENTRQRFIVGPLGDNP